VASIPATVNLGALVPITVTVKNVAPAPNSTGADELDYTINVTGALSGGGFTDLDPAGPGPGHDHDIFLDTSTAGMKSGVLTVMATSLQASSALFTLPISFNVLGPMFLAADFNQDGSVDGADLAAWTANFGVGSGATKAQGDANADGSVDGVDFLAWQQQVGSSPPALAAGAAVPEPDTAGLAFAAVSFAAAVGARRRKRWCRSRG
jgi:hypothetical protein